MCAAHISFINISYLKLLLTITVSDNYVIRIPIGHHMDPKNDSPNESRSRDSSPSRTRAGADLHHKKEKENDKDKDDDEDEDESAVGGHTAESRYSMCSADN